MVRKARIVSLGCLTMGLVGLVGCPGAFQQPVNFDLSQIGANEYEAQAGVPTQEKGTFSLTDIPVTIGSGRLEIGLDAITVTPTDTTGGKVRATQQDVNICLNACNAAGVEAETCDTVCSENVLQIRVWVGTVSDITAACDGGDEYVFLVQLNDEGTPTSIAVSPTSLTANTETLLNGGSFSVCLEVLSPIDATILIDELTFHVGI